MTALLPWMLHSVVEFSRVQYSMGIIGHTGGQMELSLTDTSSMYLNFHKANVRFWSCLYSFLPLCLKWWGCFSQSVKLTGSWGVGLSERLCGDDHSGALKFHNMEDECATASIPTAVAPMLHADSADAANWHCVGEHRLHTTILLSTYEPFPVTGHVLDVSGTASLLQIWTYHTVSFEFFGGFGHLRSACFLVLVLTLITLFTRPCCPKVSQDRTRFRTSSRSSYVTSDTCERPSFVSHVSNQADETMSESAFSIWT